MAEFSPYHYPEAEAAFQSLRTVTCPKEMEAKLFANYGVPKREFRN